jgi:hypothetical protein
VSQSGDCTEDSKNELLGFNEQIPGHRLRLADYIAAEIVRIVPGKEAPYLYENVYGLCITKHFTFSLTYPPILYDIKEGMV